MAVAVVVASSRTQKYRHTTNLRADGQADDDSCFGCTRPRFESSSAHSAAMAEHGEAPPCYGGFPSGSPRFKSGARRDSAEQALSACGETGRQVTALGSKPRATRLRSSTLRLTVAVIIGGRIHTATTCPNDSGVRLSVSYSEGVWSNGKTPASRAGDGCSIRSAPIAAIPKQSTGHGRDPCVHRPSQVRILVAACQPQYRHAISRDWVV
jgi:hypothetical protein